ncbi:MAG: anti-sigma factor family protein [Candidatus Binataceae bacterium]
MMAANHPETALVPFVRGELTGTERERVAGHLERCQRCRQEAESFRSLLVDLSGRLDELPTPDWTVYRAQLRRKLAEHLEPRAPWWRFGVGWASLATVAAAAAITLWLVIPRGPYTVPSEEQVAFEQPTDVADVGLLRNYAVVERLDLLENYDVIEHLDELKPASRPGDAARS